MKIFFVLINLVIFYEATAQKHSKKLYPVKIHAIGSSYVHGGVDNGDNRNNSPMHSFSPLRNSVLEILRIQNDSMIFIKKVKSDSKGDLTIRLRKGQYEIRPIRASSGNSCVTRWEINTGKPLKVPNDSALVVLKVTVECYAP